jgi:hypothetical protein
LKKILVVTYWDFNDPLIQTYTLPYLRAIQKVCEGNIRIYLVTFNKTNVQVPEQTVFTPIFFKYHSNKLLAGFQILASLMKLNSFIKKEKIDFIHSWCTPAGALGYLLSKFSHKPLVLDSFEPHAESMVENGTWTKNSLAFKILFRYERLQLQRAKHVIGLTLSTEKYIQDTYHLNIKNVFIKPSCVSVTDFSIYNSQQKIEIRSHLDISQQDIVCIYVGKFGGIYLDEEIYALLQSCKELWKNNFKLIILTPNSEHEVKQKLKHYKLDTHVVLLKKANTEEVIKYMNIADFAINPVKPVPSKRYCTSIKDGEYWAAGLPVIITPNISDDSDIIEMEKIGSVIHTLDKKGYEEAVQKMYNLLKGNTDAHLNEKIKGICKTYRSFDIAEKIYKDIYVNG